jgi:ABC-type uncharacterized transport system permease subunit
MIQMSHLLTLIVPAVYVLAWACYALLFFRDPPWTRRASTGLLAAGALAQLVLIFDVALLSRRCPMGNLAEILQLLVILVVAVYLALEHRQQNRYSGIFLLTPVLPVAVVTVLLPHPSGPVPALLKSPLFGMHTLLALLGYASLLVCTVYGVMYLLLRRALKRQTYGLIFHRLPSLDGLSEMTLAAAGIGFAALTLTIAVGMVWGIRAARLDQIHVQGALWHDPKILLTVLVWACYGLGLLGRFRLGWAPRRAVFCFLAGFALAVLAVILLNTWLTTFHRFTT